MNDPLDRLHQVRSLRQQRAQTDLARGRRRLDRADEELSRRQRDLEGHRRFQAKMEALLFSRMDGKAVTLGELETYRGRVSDLRTEGKAFQENMRQAQIQKDSARAEAERLDAVFHKRCRESTRLEEYRKVRITRIEEEKNRRSEEEMEEMALNRFSPHKPGS